MRLDNGFCKQVNYLVFGCYKFRGSVDEAVRCERLLNGLKTNPKYALEANLMELLPN